MPSNWNFSRGRRKALIRERAAVRARYSRWDAMRAITVLPGVANSARLDECPNRRRRMARSWCGPWRSASAAPTARSWQAPIGAAPAGRGALGARSRIARRACGSAPRARPIPAGDHVVGIVRRPDPVPCPACAAGEWDMCRNGRYTERGIKERHGYRRRALPPRAGIRRQGRPARWACSACCWSRPSIVAKAWDHAERIGRRSRCMAAAHGARHRRRPDRPAGGPDGRATRPRRARARPQRARSEAGARARPRRASITTARRRSRRLSRPTS